MELPLAPRCPDKLFAPPDLPNSDNQTWACHTVRSVDPESATRGCPPPSHLRHYRMKPKAQRRSAIPTGPEDAFQMTVAQKTRKVSRPEASHYQIRPQSIFSFTFNMLREAVAIADDLVDTGIGDLWMTRLAKLIEFWTLLLFGPDKKLIFEAFGSNGGSRPSAGLDPGCGSPAPPGRSSERAKPNHGRARRFPQIVRARATRELIHKRICVKNYLCTRPRGRGQAPHRPDRFAIARNVSYQ